MLYVITHDCRTAADHQRASAYLQSITKSLWTHIDGVWFVETGRSGVDLRQGLSNALAPGVQIVVAMLAGFAAWQGLDSETEIWLARHL